MTGTRMHLARRWHRTGPSGGLILRCTCGGFEAPEGTTRQKEDAHRAHRVAMGETVKPRVPSQLERLKAAEAQVAAVRAYADKLVKCGDSWDGNEPYVGERLHEILNNLNPKES